MAVTLQKDMVHSIPMVTIIVYASTNYMNIVF